MDLTLSAPKGRPSAAQAKGLGQRVTPLGPLALKGRNKTTHRPRGSCRGLRQCSFALSGLAARKGRILGPRPLAWAVLGRPFRAHLDTSGTPHARCPAKDVARAQPTGERTEFLRSLFYRSLAATRVQQERVAEDRSSFLGLSLVTRHCLPMLPAIFGRPLRPGCGPDRGALKSGRGNDNGHDGFRRGAGA